MKKFTLRTDFGAFEVNPADILTNDVIFPAHIRKESNPHNVQLWLIGHQYGPVCAVWASHEQDAFDCAVDSNKLDCFLIEDESDCHEDDITHLGNAGEPFDLSNAWIKPVLLDKNLDFALILELAIARESGADNLDL